jgi:hypothetical protein
VRPARLRVRLDYDLPTFKTQVDEFRIPGDALTLEVVWYFRQRASPNELKIVTSAASQNRDRASEPQ